MDTPGAEQVLLPTPIGPLRITLQGEAVERIDFAEEGGAAPTRAPDGSALDRLRAYFAGDLAALDDIPVALPESAPRFHRAVWRELRRIPAGRTRAYGELAEILGSAGASRAVGAANARNPIPIVIPCHRVIARGGSLHGYGGGLARKAWLLRHEGARFAEDESLFTARSLERLRSGAGAAYA